MKKTMNISDLANNAHCETCSVARTTIYRPENTDKNKEELASLAEKQTKQEDKKENNKL